MLSGGRVIRNKYDMNIIAIFILYESRKRSQMVAHYNMQIILPSL